MEKYNFNIKKRKNIIAKFEYNLTSDNHAKKFAKKLIKKFKGDSCTIRQNDRLVK